MKLSVVIACQNAKSSVEESLRVLLNNRRNDVEIIVVDHSTDGSAETVRTEFPKVSLVSYPEAKFIPELWEAGIRKSTGEIIALTSAHCVPEADWIDTILKAHETPYVGIGGAIENDGSSGLVGWAIYFLRYSRFMLPFSPERTLEVAADNASYKRAALELCQKVRQKGFWEPAVHAELRKNGGALWRTPDIVVQHRKSFSFFGFIGQRFWHGRQFGNGRTENLTKFGRMIHIILSPLIPGAYLYRIVREVGSKKRHLQKFLFSLPIMFIFLISWSLGEFSGYFWPSKKRI